MNTAERVVDFFRQNQGQPFCDDCVAALLGVQSPLSRMIAELNPKFVQREETLCSHCGTQKPTTMQVSGHVPPPRSRKRTTTVN